MIVTTHPQLKLFSTEIYYLAIICHNDELSSSWLVEVQPNTWKLEENGNKINFEKDLVTFCKKEEKKTESVGKQSSQLKLELNSS